MCSYAKIIQFYTVRLFSNETESGQCYWPSDIYFLAMNSWGRVFPWREEAVTFKSLPVCGLDSGVVTEIRVCIWVCLSVSLSFCLLFSTFLYLRTYVFNIFIYSLIYLAICSSTYSCDKLYICRLINLYLSLCLYTVFV